MDGGGGKRTKKEESGEERVQCTLRDPVVPANPHSPDFAGFDPGSDRAFVHFEGRCDIGNGIMLLGFVAQNSASHASENSLSANISASPPICFNLNTSSGSIPSSRPIFASDQLRFVSSCTISLMPAT